MLNEEAKEFIPPGFREALETLQPREMGTILVEVEPSNIEPIADDIDVLGYVMRSPIEAPGLTVIPTYLPLDEVDRVAELPGVKNVYYDAPKKGQDMNVPRIPSPKLPPPAVQDPIHGRIGYSDVKRQDVEIDGIPLAGFPLYATAKLNLPMEPVQAFYNGLSGFLRDIKAPSPKAPEVDRIVPTSESRQMLGAPENNKVDRTKVAVLDTGAIVKQHPLWQKDENTASFTRESAQDMIGHGTHCLTTAFGSEGDTPYGLCKGVADVAGENTYAGKVLSNLGFGSTEWILRGISWALDKGAEVISMSLGGPFKNSVQDNPEHKIMEATKEDTVFIIAAGNSGPEKHTIGSPGISPHALTVGSVNTDAEVSKFSSRGISSQWYKEHESAAKREIDEYGDDFIKPDVVGPGGDSREGNNEVIYAACQGWMDSESDMLVNSLTGLRGTSMACPSVAGLVALLKEEGKIDNAIDVKARMAKEWQASKSEDVGYGVPKYGYF